MNIYIYNILRYRHWKRLLLLVAMFIVQCSMFNVYAQIVIGGNVYGGGNAGDTGGSTTVNIYAGDLHSVYGGARQANVGGSAFLHIDGEHASNYIVIDKAYGGNDIAGSIGSSATLPSELTEVGTETGKNNIDNSWNAFVRISTKMNGDEEASDAQKIYIGQLFGGSNGDYTVKNPTVSESGKWEIWTKDATPIKVYEDDAQPQLPDIGKTYLELLGGSIVYAYGGGNNATITNRTVIALKNPSKVVNSIKDADNPNADNTGELLYNDRFEKKMGINTTFSYPSSDAYQIGRFFGGNNKADMAIRPRWNLQQGRIRNLYGGGNEGRMTSPEGLLLQIDGAGMVVDNVYGGCRKADVRPLYNNDDDTPVPYDKVALDPADNPNNIPAGYAARVRVLAGHVNNVYGGNDISGNVYAGNTVGIMTHICGDVYGGGNGSYAYTDNPALKDDPHWSDFYYNPDEVLAAAGITGVSDDLKSVTALNLIRPNAEKVSILVRGTEANPTIVDGGLYVGGNSASLRENVAGASSGNQTHIKIGSYTIIDNVFLGNNGENMIKTDKAGADGHGEGVLRTMARTDIADDDSKFNSMNLKDKDVFAKYMEGCAMKVKSTVVFESTQNGDGDNYIPYTTQFGSFYCGGNVGSMITDGKTTINFSDKVIIYNKVVGGCNSAFVTPTEYNALYEGGLLGAPDPAPTGSPEGSIGDKLQLNFDGLKIQPRRWNDAHTELIWNTIKSSTGIKVEPVTSGATPENPETSDANDLDRRFDGGNIYGGCYSSGIVNGNVVININSSIVDRDILFDMVEEDEKGEDKLYGNDQYHITKRNSGVILSEQGMDVLGKALNVFGGGKGVNTEIWGSTTINLNRGYMFQIFGGSEEGGIGNGEYNERTGKIEYTYDSRYSTYINLKGSVAGVSRKDNKSEEIAECEFIYGGGFLGPVAGNCIINLGNGRIFNSFAGACNADILGHTETYIGTNGFPYVRDYVYGGNDLGGQILNKGNANFNSRLRNDAVRSKVSNTDMLNASAYTEYVQGRVEKIYGGAYGVYDYKDAHFRAYFDEDGHAKTGYHKPFLDNAFINFRPNESNNALNTVEQIYGAGQGYLGEEEEDLMQNRSYILIDVPQAMTTFQGTEVFGAGESGGVGMGVTKATADNSETAHKASAIIDLLSGHFKAVYGGSYQEGVTRRTVVNVPAGSTFRAEAIFGGAYGLYNEYRCDVYESNVNWNSSDALVGGYRTGIYGGNNSYRRTLYSHVNINAPVYYDKANKYYATVYGAGYGKDTWAQYTEVNLNNTARVYEAYGGGQLGRVMNKKSVAAWAAEANAKATATYNTEHATWAALSPAEKATTPEPQAPHGIDLSLGTTDCVYEDTGLDNDLAEARNGKKYNTNVIINQGADVCGYMYNGSLSGAYAYGGGLGDANTPNTGDVHGTTYIALLGGTVTKDIYAAGTVGSVNNKYKVDTDDFDKPFKASANAYIEGGTARNVYGGGWRGSVGYHVGAISDSPTGDVLGETHVVIGKKDGTSFIDGLPAIERNAYGGGEGGAVFGTTNITLNNGFIGYRHFTSVPTTDTDLDYVKVGSDYYQEKLHDETWSGDGTNRLNDSGCIFGGGYIDNSSVDVTNVKMYGGYVRNSLFGGGEIAAVGRGVILASGQDNSVRTLKGIYKAGKANVELFEGNVHRNVFGGGRGYNNLGEGGTLYSDGYVFGQTEVRVHGGTVGTAKELARENGNVFGGGDIGYVYSAYEEDGKLYVGIKDGKRYDDKWEGYYYAYKKGDEAYTPSSTIPADSDPNWVMDNGEYVLTEDCKVLIEPYTRVTSGTIKYGGKDYNVGDYVPTAYLNTLGNKYDTGWDNLDRTGITIFNAVFAGGNTSSGSSTVYANATTVFGNATASIHDVYHRDLITLGTGRTGGLYGDGNLTFVDGYRGLNITNYGTDYYSLVPEITYDVYENLPAREADYYQLKYKCIQECTDKDGTTYYPQGGEHTKASTLTIDDLLTLFEGIKVGDVDILLKNSETGEYYPNPIYWEQNGVVPVYAGRLMNTIQRADFCGVFGSRMVMQGAEDRVPEIVDHTKYTINRVREVSLNQKQSVRTDDASDENKKVHGNYFGIYSIVNYLGALTSDVFFLPNKDIRVTDNTSNPDYITASKAYDGGNSKEYGTATYYDWKAGFVNERKRNNGTSKNKVALASGVYLELTTENSTGDDLYEKDWGYITGVIELDLINVQPGMGGGFVYAKNVHKVGSYIQHKHNTLTALNANAVTRRDFTFNGADVKWETSGNFIHSTQTIIDDCYNVSGKYTGSDAVPAHYWFIQGSVYVYDQYISAYTGAPNAYSETVDIPLTITAASHGTMKLLNVMPNKYAYYSAPGTKIGADKKIVINDVEYHLNDPISYWDWYLLTSSEKNLFVDETYVTTADCKYSSESADIIPAGTVMLPAEYAAAKNAHPQVYHIEKQQDVDFDFVYRSSNNMSHDTGFMLTYRVNNPTDWNTWYTKAVSDNPIAEKQQVDADGYEDGPTYRLKTGSTGGVLGQREYQVSNLIAENIYTTYQTMKTNHSSAIPGGQAEFEKAYIVTNEYTNGDVHLNVGSSVSATQAASMTGYVDPAFICTSTIQLSKTEFIYVGNRMTQAEKDAYKTAYPSLATIIEADIVPAYYCTKDGLYGGNYYEANKNYRGLEVWSSMSKTDRENFEFNYDAFDVLIDPRYGWNEDGTSVIHPERQKYEYDSAVGNKTAAEANPAGYSLEKPVDYKATYNGSETSKHNGIELVNGQEYSRTQYESLPNEKRHYTTIDVKEAGNVYVVKTAFLVGNTPYAVGTVISANTYNSLGQSDQANVTTLTFTDAQKGKYYYCRENYTVGENDEGVAVTGVAVTGGVTGTYDNGKEVPVGLVITEVNFNSLPNWQTDFTIHGIAPTETSTLYVSRFSDIFDLSKEKIITVIYEYNYEETDASGTHVTPVSERHVVNIHVVFKSGVPFVEDIKAPQIVLPGTYVGVREPHVTPGAYEVTGGGWKLFEKIGDAESHINGIEYTPTADPLYWYQDGFYLAYYAKTYLGETYSNHVQVSVANYHDLTKVLEDKEHHYYVDNKNVKRDSKVYITDGTNGATQLKQIFDLSLLDKTVVDTDENGLITTDKSTSAESPFKGHSLLDGHVKAGQNLEFFLHTNVKHTGEWTPIGTDNNCFEGNLHGDGYYIDGLNNSLFYNLCGNVYNLGVTGSFSSAGIADMDDATKDKAYMENCWINTSATSGFDSKAILGTPAASTRKKVVNCYYQQTKAKTDTNPVGYTASDATPMPDADFYNGTVAYDLNGFYLYKRYNNTKTGSGTAHTFYTINTDGTLSAPQTKNYVEQNATYCSSGIKDIYTSKDKDNVDYGGYVEDRYADGDYRYANGTIPEGTDERLFVGTEDKTHFYPVWPDDYIYFGQMLTYDWNNQRPHENVPSRIVKNNGRLPNTDESNRVYRAPAYYQSKEMNVAHFNPNVNLVAYSKPKGNNDKDLKTAYPNMTAIDFAGHNDTEYKLGFNGQWFYQPLLDDDGLQRITNRDETPNLLVYAPSEEANKKTFDVLTAYFKEPAYSDYYTGGNYRCVNAAPTDKVFGHLVQNNLTAISDHLLVDKKDFNCPISYSIIGGKRMWYQRTPDLFVNLTKGWEGISLPFTAELVTTQTKGEITHFYSGSRSVDENGTKVGHEYWLREYKGKKEETGNTFTAYFNYPEASGDTKTVANTFLWDYYYSWNGESNNAGPDKNTDTYQTYYKTGRTLEHYPLLATANPYIIGFPGKTYYEFDLSGEWTPSNTANPVPDPVVKQTISFVSGAGIEIGVSDDELTATSINGYTFMPNYMSKKVDGYLMNADGNGFNITTEPTAAVPFRPYFVAASGTRTVEQIIFGQSDTPIGVEEHGDPTQDDATGTLLIYAKKSKIVVKSSLSYATDVRVVSAAGITVAAFAVEPGQTVEVRADFSGMYIVHTLDGLYTKKVTVRK